MVAQVRSSWHRRRLDGVTLWAQAELRLGRPAVVLTVLHDLVVGRQPSYRRLHLVVTPTR
jgi:hypothetical protein